MAAAITAPEAARFFPSLSNVCNVRSLISTCCHLDLLLCSNASRLLPLLLLHLSSLLLNLSLFVSGKFVI